LVRGSHIEARGSEGRGGSRATGRAPTYADVGISQPMPTSRLCRLGLRAPVVIRESRLPRSA
jgi:hypothetical protein